VKTKLPRESEHGSTQALDSDSVVCLNRLVTFKRIFKGILDGKTVPTRNLRGTKEKYPNGQKALVF